MRAGVIGINHKLAGLRLREKLAKACHKWFGIGQAHHEIHSFILLSTCNRTEVYFSSENLAETHSYVLQFLRNEVEEEFDHKLYSYFGVDCFSHLTRVTLGLDSAIVGETEIQGQVKLAYENTTALYLLPKELHFLFQKSLSIAKQIRTQLPLCRGIQSFEEAIFQAGKKIFPIPREARLLFVGASQINQKILLFLQKKKCKHISICNRSDQEGKMWQCFYGVHHLPWSQLSQWHMYDWVIFGTKSPNYLIAQDDSQFGCKSKKLILDLSVPRNVHPNIALDPYVTLLNIDQVNASLKIRSHHDSKILVDAEQRVHFLTKEHAMRYLEKSKDKIEQFAITA
jgi:glutamyl-tRNA reductase